MLDSGASINVISLKVMKQLGLKTTRPYGNVCGIDSRRVKVLGVCEDVEVFLIGFPHITVLMDMLVIDVPDAWGMVLSRTWSLALGGFLSMNLTHAYIPMGDGTYEILHNMEKKDTHVMNLRGPNYVSEHYHDIPPQIIEYDPSELPFMKEDAVEMFLPWTNKKKTAQYHRKETELIHIIQREDVKNKEFIEDTIHIEPPRRHTNRQLDLMDCHWNTNQLIRNIRD
jgi:hypothetical protein